ncbi:MATE family efflux transporter [bacterium]|nr:MATE family efflux transporter [bacterium]
MSIYQIVDVFFVSRFVGTNAVAAINIVLPITFLISSFGMAVGIGGGSIISRALGAEDKEKAARTFGNQISLTLGFSLFFVAMSFIFSEPILRGFGSNDEVLPLARDYFHILLLGVPFLGWAMMSNNVIRAEGKPKIAMLTLVIPAVANLILDPILIYYLDMGIKGAAWATTIGYWCSGLYTLWFFLRNKSEIPLHIPNFKLRKELVREIGSIGSVTLVRQGSFSLLAVVLNNSLEHYGGTIALAIYGLIRGFTLFVAFPNIGIMQGLMPIVGFNHGAERYDRLKESLRLSVIWTTATSLSLFILLAIFSKDLVHLFTDDPELMERTPRALVITFLGLPTMGISFIAAAYFQAIGKTKPAMILTLARQGMFMIPLALILPLKFGLDGIWFSMPIGEILAALISSIWLYRAVKDF